MRKSKSCEDIRINVRGSQNSTNVDSNVLISNLMKTKPSKKAYELETPDAYDLLMMIRNGNQETTQFIKPSFLTHRGHLRKTYSQEEFDQLFNIQQKLKTQALNSLCKKTAIASRIPLMMTAKQLASLNYESLEGSMKRSTMGRLIMAKAMESKTKKTHKQNLNSFQSSQTLQSLTNKTFQTTKGSIQQEKCQQQAFTIQKIKKFQQILSKVDYNQVLNTERRKQAWRAFHDAERNKIKMLRSEKARNAYIKLNNDLRKISKKNKKNNKSCQDEQSFIQTMNYCKQFGKDFEFLSENYKLGQK